MCIRDSYVTYPQILNVLTRLSGSRMPVGPALFRRIVFNVAVSNSDDHARNHAALWDGEHLRLSPAYDLCPGPRSGQTAEQAMAFGRSGIRTSTFHAAISVAAEYGLSTSDARSVVDDVVSAITDHYAEAADQARLSEADRTAMLGRQFLNPGAVSYTHLDVYKRQLPHPDPRRSRRARRLPRACLLYTSRCV